DEATRLVPVNIRIDAERYGEFYGTGERPAASYPGTLVQSSEGRMLRFDAGASLPEPLATIQGVSQSRDGELQGGLVEFSTPAPPPAAQPADTAAPAAPAQPGAESPPADAAPQTA